MYYFILSALVSNVTDAVEMLIQHFSSATNQAELAFLGDSKQTPACAKIALNALCPALYAIFRDGLKENIETSFGAVNNSVWQMVEATARQGKIYLHYFYKVKFMFIYFSGLFIIFIDQQSTLLLQVL